MSHEITKIDKHQGIKQAWHKLTEVCPKLTYVENWLNTWDVLPKPLQFADGTDSGYRIFTASDNPAIVIGEPFNPGSYGAITNRTLLDMISGAMAGVPHKIVSLGSLKARTRVFFVVEIEELHLIKVGHREFGNYLNFLNSFDKSADFRANLSTICTVCNNTFTLNLHDNQKKAVNLRVRHSKNVKEELAGIPKVIDAAIGVRAEFEAALKGFAAIPCTQNRAERIYAGFLTPKVEDISEVELSTRRSNQIGELTRLFKDGDGNQGENLLDVFSGATEYYTRHSAGGEDVQKQIDSSEIGAGATAKSRIYSILTNEDTTEQTAQWGKKVLALA